ncbi:hypothetical protein Hypma_004032 [Hypsizygus marmoreus]|uniref:Uncharacterized protein n=1 Tax=Hypsizygus marmoreus TaxID=39966 RepID=A0A369J0U3_HYPMA|nr:hypothetical protein Hypma_004032 [Hypsizygus marmoreus]
MSTSQLGYSQDHDSFGTVHDEQLGGPDIVTAATADLPSWTSLHVSAEASDTGSDIDELVEPVPYRSNIVRHNHSWVRKPTSGEAHLNDGSSFREELRLTTANAAGPSSHSPVLAFVPSTQGSRSGTSSSTREIHDSHSTPPTSRHSFASTCNDKNRAPNPSRAIGSSRSSSFIGVVITKIPPRPRRAPPSTPRVNDSTSISATQISGHGSVPSSTLVSSLRRVSISLADATTSWDVTARSSKPYTTAGGSVVRSRPDSALVTPEHGPSRNLPESDSVKDDSIPPSFATSPPPSSISTTPPIPSHPAQAAPPPVDLLAPSPISPDALDLLAGAAAEENASEMVMTIDLTNDLSNGSEPALDQIPRPAKASGAAESLVEALTSAFVLNAPKLEHRTSSTSKGFIVAPAIAKTVSSSSSSLAVGSARHLDAPLRAKRVSYARQAKAVAEEAGRPRILREDKLEALLGAKLARVGFEDVYRSGVGNDVIMMNARHLKNVITTQRDRGVNQVALDAKPSAMLVKSRADRFTEILDDTFGHGSDLRGHGRKSNQMMKKAPKSGVPSETSRNGSTDPEEDAVLLTNTVGLGLGLKRPMDEAEDKTQSKKVRTEGPDEALEEDATRSSVDEGMAEGWVSTLQQLIKGKTSFDRERMQGLNNILDQIDLQKDRVSLQVLEATRLKTSMEQLSELVADDLPFEDEHDLCGRAKEIVEYWKTVSEAP